MSSRTPPTPLRALIVDDEPPARRLLRALVEGYTAGVTVVAEADDLDAAAEAVQLSRPDLILLDVNLGGQSGFGLFDRVDLSGAQVVFVTAYTEYAIDALRKEAVDYLVKPINVTQLRGAIARVQARLARAAAVARPRLLSIPYQEGRRLIPHHEICRVEADGSYSRIVMAEGDTLYVVRKIGKLEEDLAGGSFVRCHRSHLVNRRYISRYRAGVLTLTDGTTVVVSRKRAPEVRQLLVE